MQKFNNHKGLVSHIRLEKKKTFRLICAMQENIFSGHLGGDSSISERTHITNEGTIFGKAVYPGIPNLSKVFH